MTEQVEAKLKAIEDSLKEARNALIRSESVTRQHQILDRAMRDVYVLWRLLNNGP